MLIELHKVNVSLLFHVFLKETALRPQFERIQPEGLLYILASLKFYFLNYVTENFGVCAKSLNFASANAEVRRCLPQARCRFGSLAQLNRASDYGSEGYRFESCRSHPARDILATKASLSSGAMLFRYNFLPNESISFRY